MRVHMHAIRYGMWNNSICIVILLAQVYYLHLEHCARFGNTPRVVLPDAIVSVTDLETLNLTDLAFHRQTI